MDIFNLFDHTRFSELEETDEGIFENEKVRALRTLSLNQVTDYMVQDEDEVVILMEGLASIETESEIVRMKKGDFLFIPRGLRHRVIDQDRAVWFCLFVKI